MDKDKKKVLTDEQIRALKKQKENKVLSGNTVNK